MIKNRSMLFATFYGLHEFEKYTLKHNILIISHTYLIRAVKNAIYFNVFIVSYSVFDSLTSHVDVYDTDVC